MGGSCGRGRTRRWISARWWRRRWRSGRSGSTAGVTTYGGHSPKRSQAVTCLQRRCGRSQQALTTGDAVAVLTLDDFPLEEIRQEAAKIKFGEFLLSMIGWVLYHAAFLVTLLFTKVIWGSVRFTVASCKAGSVAAKGPSKRAIIEAQTKRLREYEIALARFEG